jgi:Translationally controlled tumour protein
LFLTLIYSISFQDSGANVNIGCGNEFGGGAEEVDDNAEYVNNVVDESLGFDLHEVPMSKKDLKEYLQTYCKNLRQKLKEDDKIAGPDVKGFTQSAPEFCKYILSKYDDLQFFTSSSMDPDGSMAFAYYETADPIFIYIKMGLIEEKC